jgi:hypothetical protein
MSGLRFPIQYIRYLGSIARIVQLAEPLQVKVLQVIDRYIADRSANRRASGGGFIQSSRFIYFYTLMSI